MEQLDLSTCTTNKEVCELVSKRVSEVSFEDLLKEVNKHFVFMEEATRAIYTGLSMNMNVFLSGPGGYGKSSLIKFILEFYKIPYHTVIGYKDMPVDALLGIPNMDKLLNKSIYEINFKESVFYKPGILIGEEFTDILPSTAAVLKDILTEKGFRNKNEKVESLIATMIIAANKSSVEISDDNSKKALYEERFPLKVNVVWKEFTAENYYELLSRSFNVEDYKGTKEQFKKELYFMAKLFEENFITHNNLISPRTAINITKVFLNSGLMFISEFDIILDSWESIKRKSEIEYYNKDVINSLETTLNFIKNSFIGESRLLHLLYFKLKLSQIQVKDSVLNEYIKINKQIDDEILRITREKNLTSFNKIDKFLNIINHD